MSKEKIDGLQSRATIQVYRDPNRESDPYALPDVEVFYVGEGEITMPDDSVVITEDSDCEHYDSGWYWWSCFPGCIPDSDMIGPFDSESEAIDDATGDWG